MIDFIHNWQYLACVVMVIGSVFMGLKAAIYQNRTGIKYSMVCFLIAVSAALLQTGS
jgi:tRNA U34 5-carboxymethylaminomethyl modifying enzyme MnmG/GidA